MNDQQIYMLIAKTPDIRAVQIADALDKDLSDVSEALRPLVEVGDVVRHAGKSPNGHPAQLYNLSPAFKASKEGQAILAMISMEAPAAPAVIAAAVPPALASIPAAPQPGPAPLVIPQLRPVPPSIAARKVPSPAKRAALGLEFARTASREVSQDEMRDAMGLKKSQYPGPFLKSAIEGGHLHRVGSMFKAGPAPVAEAEQVALAEQVAPAAAVCRPVTAPATAQQTTGQFRCGLWSDGVLELQRDGVTLVQLAQDEGEHLVSFFGRMLANPMGGTVQTSAPPPGKPA